MSPLDGPCPQRAMPLVRPAMPAPEPPLETIARLRSRQEAIALAIVWSGLTEGEVADGLGIDPGQWSRIRSGKAHLPTEAYQPFGELVGNRVLLAFDAFRAGYRLEPLESALERQLREERERRVELEAKLVHFEEFMRIGAGR